MQLGDVTKIDLLIELQQNVKGDTLYRWKVQATTFNRTTVECKVTKLFRASNIKSPFNRTTVECKVIYVSTV